MRQLTKFERKIQTQLNGILDRKYQLWQQTEGGQIVGFYYTSVSVAFRERSEPGWVYLIEAGGDIYHIHEESVIPVGTN